VFGVAHPGFHERYREPMKVVLGETRRVSPGLCAIVRGKNVLNPLEEDRSMPVIARLDLQSGSIKTMMRSH
jgi:hypothetical protein